MPITAAELVCDMMEMIEKICQEEGIDKDEFLTSLGALL